MGQPAGFVIDTSADTGGLPTGFEKDIRSDAAERGAKLRKENTSSPKPSALRRFTQNLGMPTSVEEFKQLFAGVAQNPSPFATILNNPSLVSNPSIEAFNQALNPLTPLMENIGTDIGNADGISADTAGSAVPVLAAAFGGPKAVRTAKARIFNKPMNPVQPIPIPVETPPVGLGTKLLGHGVDELISRLWPTPGSTILGDKARAAITKPRGSGVSFDRASGYMPAADPLVQHTFDPAHLVRKPAGGDLYDLPTNFEGQWSPMNAAYAEAGVTPGITRMPILMDDIAPTYIKGAQHETVKDATSISPPAPYSLPEPPMRDFGTPEVGPLPTPEVPDFASPSLRTGEDWFQPVPEAVYGDAFAAGRDPWAPRMKSPNPTGATGLMDGPVELFDQGSRMTQDLPAPPLGPRDIQGINNQTSQLEQFGKISGQYPEAPIPMGTVGFSPQQLQFLMELLSGKDK